MMLLIKNSKNMMLRAGTTTACTAARGISSKADMDVILQELPKVYGKAFSQIFPLYDSIAGKVSASLGDKMPTAILDLGCGPGEPGLTLAANYPNAHVLVTDNNDDMLAKATARIADAGVQNAEVRKVDVSNLASVPDGSQDVVTASLLLHITQDEARNAAVSEIARVLRPEGGVLVASVWEEMPHMKVMGEVMKDLTGDAVPLPFDPFGFSKEVSDAMFAEAGLGAVKHEVVPLDFNMGDVNDDQTWKLGMIIHLAKILEMAGSDPTVIGRVKGAFATRCREEGLLTASGELAMVGHFRTMTAVKP
jgi:SAM-dependent methyltransferase